MAILNSTPFMSTRFNEGFNDLLDLNKEFRTAPHIELCFEKAVQKAQKANQPIACKYEHKIFIVSPNDSPAELAQKYNSDKKREYDAYWTPERIAEKRARELEELNKMNKIYLALPEIFQDMVNFPPLRTGLYDQIDIDAHTSREFNIQIAQYTYALVEKLGSHDKFLEWEGLNWDEKKKWITTCEPLSKEEIIHIQYFAREYFNCLEDY